MPNLENIQDLDRYLAEHHNKRVGEIAQDIERCLANIANLHALKRPLTNSERAAGRIYLRQLALSRQEMRALYINSESK